MKGLITAAGLGTRSGLDGKLRKEMLPVYDIRNGKIALRPIVDVILTEFARNAIEEVAVVLDPDDRWTREYLESNFPKATLLFQEERHGYGHAVLMAKDFIGTDDFILNAGDGLVLNDYTIKNMVSASESSIYLALIPVPNPEKYGCPVIASENGNSVVKGVIEKPRSPPSNFALCALYRLTPKIFNEIDASSENIELTPAIDRVIRKGSPVYADFLERKEWVSVGKAESYVDVLKATLEKARDKVTS